MKEEFTADDFEFSENFFDKFSFDPELPVQGDILISEPFLEDPNFTRTVIYISEFNKDGAMGFILNRPTKIPVHEVLPELGNVHHPIYYGGPVGNDKLFYIHTLGNKLKNAVRIKNDLFWGGNFNELKLLAKEGLLSNKNIKFFAGYTGWEATQLETEILEKSWIKSTFNESCILENFDEKLWQKELRTLGRKFEIMSHFPADPSMN